MKKKHIITHMKTAYLYADLSYCKRRKVGCVIVKEDRIISIGYNGTPKGWQNICEDENGNTLPHVFHAETNAISKLAKSSESSEGCSIFITDSPCIDCAKLIFQSGFKEVFYNDEYRNTDGIAFLKKCKIPVYKINIEPRFKEVLADFTKENLEIEEQ